MPVSKKRKKKGKKVVGRVASENLSGVTLQDLINVLAYQEYVQDGTIVRDDAKMEAPEIDFEDPVTRAAIETIASIDKNEEQE